MIGVTDDKHYKNIAKTLRDSNFFYEDTVEPSRMAYGVESAIAEAIAYGDVIGFEDGFSEGFSEGEKQGKSDTIRAMWEAIQSGGQRDNYQNLLNYTSYTKKTFKPIYDIKPTGTGVYNWMYNVYRNGSQCLLDEGQVNMKELEEEQGIKFDFSGCTNMTRTFAHGLFSELNVIDMSNATVTDYVFYGGQINHTQRDVLAPKRIERLICSETTKFVTSSFQFAVGFKYIGFEGVIASDINVSWSPLDNESLTKLLTILSDSATGKTVSVSKSAVDKAFETSEGANDGSETLDWDDLVNAKPNWTVSLV